jgi:hypothetical protein
LNGGGKITVRGSLTAAEVQELARIGSNRVSVVLTDYSGADAVQFLRLGALVWVDKSFNSADALAVCKAGGPRVAVVGSGFSAQDMLAFARTGAQMHLIGVVVRESLQRDNFAKLHGEAAESEEASASSTAPTTGTTATPPTTGTTGTPPVGTPPPGTPVVRPVPAPRPPTAVRPPPNARPASAITQVRSSVKPGVGPALAPARDERAAGGESLGGQGERRGGAESDVVAGSGPRVDTRNVQGILAPRTVNQAPTRILATGPVIRAETRILR